jgi:DNA-binding transcriptional LysR family regulator
MDPDWTLWRTFLAVAEAGSLSAAARRLGLTQPTLGRHVEALEGALGVALFTRGPKGLALTPAGLAALPAAQAMGLAAGALARAVAGAGATTGTLRLTAAGEVAAEVLPPVLAHFAALHPGIALEISASDRPEDLLHREADLAVRMLRPRQVALVARKVAVVGLGLYAHADYLAARGVPVTGADLSGHALIGPERADRLTGVRLAGRVWGPGDLTFRSDSDAAQLGLLRAGAGIGICQHGIASREGLVRVLPDAELQLEAWLAMHEDQRGNPALRALWDHLAAELPGAFQARSSLGLSITT